jgi:predicted amidohydrolase YtcJ
VYGAVNRKTMTGDTLGYDQRISAYQALKAITSEAAYQWGEDDTKGQLKKDYIADMVVLDKDPVTIDPNEIKKVNVLYTFKNGKQVYPFISAGKH